MTGRTFGFIYFTRFRLSISVKKTIVQKGLMEHDIRVQFCWLVGHGLGLEV